MSSPFQIPLFESDGSSRAQFARQIEQFGHQVACADSCRKAAALLLHHTPDLAIIGASVPDADGFIRDLRAQIAFRDLPICVRMITTEAAERQRFMLAGASDFIMPDAESCLLRLRLDCLLRLWSLQRQTLHLTQEASHAQGRLTEMCYAYADLEQRVHTLTDANAQLEQFALIDPMTGLKNRRAFDEALEREYQFAVRYRTFLSVLLVDVDGFTAYHETFGQAASDQLLQQISGQILRTVRSTDVAAYFGQDVFAVILPHTDGEGACSIGERLRRGAEQTEWPTQTMTVSIGIAVRMPQTCDAAQMLQEARQAVQQAKQAGRNQFFIPEDSLTSRYIRHSGPALRSA